VAVGVSGWVVTLARSHWIGREEGGGRRGAVGGGQTDEAGRGALGAGDQSTDWVGARHVPVGYGQARRGWVVTTQSCWSRAFAGTLVFSKEAPDILAGLARSISRLGVRPEKLVWDRESAIAGRGKPSVPFLSFCGQMEVVATFLSSQPCKT
jgi:hypothetical protein